MLFISSSLLQNNNQNVLATLEELWDLEGTVTLIQDSVSVSRLSMARGAINALMERSTSRNITLLDANVSAFR